MRELEIGRAIERPASERDCENERKKSTKEIAKRSFNVIKYWWLIYDTHKFAHQVPLSAMLLLVPCDFMPTRSGFTKCITKSKHVRIVNASHFHMLCRTFWYLSRFCSFLSLSRSLSFLLSLSHCIDCRILLDRKMVETSYRFATILCSHQKNICSAEFGMVKECSFSEPN